MASYKWGLVQMGTLFLDTHGRYIMCFFSLLLVLLFCFSGIAHRPLSCICHHLKSPLLFKALPNPLTF